MRLVLIIAAAAASSAIGANGERRSIADIFLASRAAARSADAVVVSSDQPAVIVASPRGALQSLHGPVIPTRRPGLLAPRPAFDAAASRGRPAVSLREFKVDRTLAAGFRAGSATRASVRGFVRRGSPADTGRSAFFEGFRAGVLNRGARPARRGLR